MLPKVFRLKKKAEFQKVYREGKSVSTAALVLISYKKEQKRLPRIGFAVGKKIGTAVSRNRIKRLMREALRPYIEEINPNYDLIFVARIKIKGISLHDVEMEMA